MMLVTDSLTSQVIQQSLLNGIRDFCICPGARNASFIQCLKQQNDIHCFYFYDERSAGFFALGRSRAMQRPVAIITTSGSATAYLLAPAMEAYYTAIPLLLITADRPRHFRGCNSPQSCDQVNLYGPYTPFSLDIEEGETLDISTWDQRSPAHINVCLEEPKSHMVVPYNSLSLSSDFSLSKKTFGENPHDIAISLNIFLAQTRHPLVIVSNIKENAKEAICEFLIRLNAPVILEATSRLREEVRLSHLRITRTEMLWDSAEVADYPIDSILRIGGVPTLRLWRDLESKHGQVKVYSINESPFSGLSWGPIAYTALNVFFANYIEHKHFPPASKWLADDHYYQRCLLTLFEEEPLAEPSLIYTLSKKLPLASQIFVGTSLPIREWDLAATYEDRGYQIYASRGVNGIDGQISTVLGLSSSERSNWALLGDLTTLHDMSGPWIIPQLPKRPLHFVVINNGGGKIFDKMFQEKELQNEHSLNFKPLAQLWNLSYECWLEIPREISVNSPALIELQPDHEATRRFWKKLDNFYRGSYDTTNV